MSDRLTRGRRDRGATIPIVALVLPVLVLATAFAIDLGRQRDLRRDLQANADVIALDLVRLLDGTDATPDAATTLTALNGSLARNQMDSVSSVDGTEGAKVQWGRWTPPVPGQECPLTIISEPPDCFLAVPAAGSTPVNAVRVTLDGELDYFFQPGQGSATRAAIATRGGIPQGEFLMGSSLLSISPPTNTIIGQTLSQVLPGAEVLSYQGLADADVTLADLALGLGLASADELADADVTFGQLILASATALQASGGDPAQVALLNELAALEVNPLTVNAGEVLGLDAGQPGAGLAGTVNIPQLLLAGVQVANGFSAVSIPPSQLTAEGLASVTFDLTAINRPVRVGTSDGAHGSTDQLGLGVDIGIAINADQSQNICTLPPSEKGILGPILGLVTQLLNCLFSPVLRTLDVRIDGNIGLDLTLAEVTGTQALDCSTPALTVGWDTGPVTVDVDAALSVSASLGGIPLNNLLGVNVPASATADGFSGDRTFTAVDDGPVHTEFTPSTSRIGAPSLGLSNLLTLHGLDVTLLNTNLPIVGNLARGLVAPLLNGILEQVDNLVLSELSRLLGLNLGGADLTPQWMQCDENQMRLVG